MNIEPVNAKRTYQYITEQIITLIVNGELNAGERLPPERMLAERFEVSRSSIREAFRALEIIGIIEVKPEKRTYVTDFNIAPFINTIAPLFIRNVDIKDDLMDFRLMLEGEAVKLAARVHDQEGINRMEKTIHAMEKAIQDNNQTDSEKADVDFHMSIFKATRNHIYMKAGECLSYILTASIHSNRIKLLKNKHHSVSWYNEHCKICDAVKSGHEQEAYDKLCSHLNNVRQSLNGLD
jgi:GntR family transcriptional regulator, transcriptional repressor for pyruvate dehydrogenase complex